MTVEVYAGTVGWGVWYSDDLGRRWQPCFRAMPMEIRVWSLSVHRGEPNFVYAGTDIGLLRQREDRKAVHIPSPADGKQVWAVNQHPFNPATIFIGTNPGHLYRSDDAGASWQELPIELVEECLIGKPRITRIRFDPLDEDTVWVSAEIDAVHRSNDGGKTWMRLEDGFSFPDVHDLAITAADGKRRLLAATAVGLYISENEGINWHKQELPSPWQYTRGLKPKADDDGTLFLCNGNGPPGSKGRLLRSRDCGRTWVDAHLPGSTNSTPWMVATNPTDPSLLFCCTNLGQIFRSDDGGESWLKLEREFGEIRTMLWHEVN